MKKLILVTLSIILVCVGVNLAVINAKSYDEIPSTGNRTYIIKEYYGRVACFEVDSTEPFIITERFVRDLPPIDRKMLLNGVEVVGAKSLSRALEDYNS